MRPPALPSSAPVSVTRGLLCDLTDAAEAAVLPPQVVAPAENAAHPPQASPPASPSSPPRSDPTSGPPAAAWQVRLVPKSRRRRFAVRRSLLGLDHTDEHSTHLLLAPQALLFRNDRPLGRLVHPTVEWQALDPAHVGQEAAEGGLQDHHPVGRLSLHFADIVPVAAGSSSAAAASSEALDLPVDDSFGQDTLRVQVFGRQGGTNFAAPHAFHATGRDLTAALKVQKQWQQYQARHQAARSSTGLPTSTANVAHSSTLAVQSGDGLENLQGVFNVGSWPARLKVSGCWLAPLFIALACWRCCWGALRLPVLPPCWRAKPGVPAEFDVQHSWTLKVQLCVLQCCRSSILHLAHRCVPPTACRASCVGSSLPRLHSPTRQKPLMAAASALQPAASGGKLRCLLR